MHSQSYLPIAAIVLATARANPQPQFDPAQLISALPSELSAEIPALETAIPQFIQSEGGELLDQLSAIIASVAPTAAVSDAAAAGSVVTAAGGAIETDLNNALQSLPDGIIPPEVISALSAAVPELVGEAEAEMSEGLQALPGSFALSDIPSFLSQYLTTAEDYISTALPALASDLPEIVSEIGQLTASGAVPTGLPGIGNGNGSIIASAGASSGAAPPAATPTPSSTQHIATGAAVSLCAWNVGAAGAAAFVAFAALL